MGETKSLEVAPLLDKMVGELKQTLGPYDLTTIRMIGIQTGGAWIADLLHKRLDLDTPLGTLNISFYRDDFSRIGMHPQVAPSNLPFSVEDQTIILVDDVLQSGRTVRAAMNEIFDFGRPAAIILAVLVDRTGRELPIQADITGTMIELGPDEQVKLTGPDELKLSVLQR